MAIREHLTALADEIPAGCTLIAVSKTQAPEKILEAYHWGQRQFAENRVQELTSKYERLPKDIEWHMIGHLQSNKVKSIASFVTLIHSVDSLKLLEEINRQGGRIGRCVPCLLQVHIAEEETKFGFSPEELPEFLSSLNGRAFGHVQVMGLMGMATFTPDEQEVRKEFRRLKELFDRLRMTHLPDVVNMRHLSMGMSGDYKIAIEEGSTMVRVGTAIFGERTPG
jgi:pyridoxal phosphate enzyme (YggS family)